jgi:hypothetical protein
MDDNPAVLRASMDNGKKYEFGIEVPRNPKHVSQLDQEKGNVCLESSLGLELKQLDDYVQDF